MSDLLSLKDVVARARVSRSTALRHIIPHLDTVHFGRTVRYTSESLTRLLAEKTVEAEAA
jgi:hypothetical protein